MPEIIDRFDSTEFAFLSNFYRWPIEWEGRTWPTTEHAYQAAKLNPSLANSTEQQEMIQHCASPALAKRLGRRIEMRSDWDAVKLEIMRELLWIKFSDPILRKKLRATGNTELIEGNWWNDTFWGVCDGVGQNWLGRLLMQIREAI
jgi:ribA/ribD-fused uncharacterized protein